MTLITRKKIQTLIKEFEAEYFKSRADNSSAKRTYKSEYQAAFSKLPQTEKLSLSILETTLKLTQPNSRMRKHYAFAFAALARFAGLPDASLKQLKGDYSPFDLPPRELPSDKLISDTFASLANKPDWQWVFGMIATYGLRSNEVFRVSVNESFIVKVPQTHIQERRINPIYPEWAEQWNLQSYQVPNCTGSYEDLGRRVGSAFSRYSVPFKPSDLRHRWSARALEFGCDPTSVAQQMGVSLWAYSRIYHTSLSRSVSDTAYQRVLNNPDRPKPPL